MMMAEEQETVHIVRALGQYLDCPAPILESALAWQREAARERPAAAAGVTQRRIGEFLIEGGHVTPQQLEDALMRQRVDRLACCPLFPGFTNDELMRLARVAGEVSIEQGEVFIHRDSVGDCLFVIAAGSVQVIGHYDGAEESTLATLGPGECIGEMGYFTGGRRTASVRAIQRTELLRLSYHDLEECFRVVPNLAGGFLKIITHRLRDLNQQYSASTHRARISEQSLKHLSEYLDLSEHLSLGTGIEALIDRVVTTASKLLRAERASLFLVDPVRGELWSKVAQGVERREIRVPMGHGLIGWVAQHGETLNIKDAYDDPRFKRDTDQRTGYRTRTVLCGPVRNLQGEIIGVIQVINKDEGLFHELDEQLFKAFAHQAAIAVENFNLYRRLIGSHEKMTVMLDVATALTQTLELPDLIRKIVAKVTQIVQCDRSAFFVLDHETQELWSMEAHGSTLKEIRFPVTAGLAGHTARTGDVLNIADAYEDPRFNQAIDKATGYRTRSVLCVPTLDREGKVMGVTQAINKFGGERFGDEDAVMLKAISSQIGVAVENAQLYARTVSMKNYLQSVQESISNSILTLDEEYRIVTANKAALRLLDAVPAQCLKRDLREVLGTTNSYLLGLIDEVYAGSKGAAAMDMELSPGGDKTSTVNASVLPLSGPDDARQGLVVVLEDITREKRVKSLLIKKMAKGVVERLLSDPQMQKLGGQRGESTILFCDIRGFTTISEAMTAEQTVELLNGYFTRMVEVVHEHGGMLDKFMGDALMALYGVPFPEADDAVRAVRTALAMQRALVVFNTARQAEGLPPICVGVGINSGEVVYGNIGSESRSDFTVIGDTVNLASRVEGMNKMYGSQILVTEFTRARLGDHFALRPVDHVRVKGKRERTEVFEVLGETGYELSAGQRSFGLGLSAYRQRAFGDAMTHFRNGAETDPCCQVFADRCRQLIALPPPSDWDGVWHLESK
jgi:adenylate cyclase